MTELPRCNCFVTALTYERLLRLLRTGSGRYIVGRRPLARNEMRRASSPSREALCFPGSLGRTFEARDRLAGFPAGALCQEATKRSQKNYDADGSFAVTFDCYRLWISGTCPARASA